MLTFGPIYAHSTTVTTFKSRDSRKEARDGHLSGEEADDRQLSGYSMGGTPAGVASGKRKYTEAHSNMRSRKVGAAMSSDGVCPG